MSAESSTPKIIGRPYLSGQSGNPGGLSAAMWDRIRRGRLRLSKLIPKAIRVIDGLLDDPDPEVRQKTATAVLDRVGLRGWSIEPERVELTTPVDVDALRAVLAVRVAALAAAASVDPPMLAEPPADSPGDSQGPPASAIPPGNATRTAISAEAGTASDMRSEAEDGATGGAP